MLLVFSVDVLLSGEPYQQLKLQKRSSIVMFLPQRLLWRIQQQIWLFLIESFEFFLWIFIENQSQVQGQVLWCSLASIHLLKGNEIDLLMIHFEEIWTKDRLFFWSQTEKMTKDTNEKNSLLLFLLMGLHLLKVGSTGPEIAWFLKIPL